MGLDGPDDARVLLGGGIGAGKSTVAEEFGRFGFTVFDADAIGAEVLRPGTDATDAVAQRWPAVVSNGVVDRKSLAQIVFSDADELQRLESMTHPSIRDEITRLVSVTQGPVLVETPLQHLTIPRRLVQGRGDRRPGSAHSEGGQPRGRCPGHPQPSGLPVV